MLKLTCLCSGCRNLLSLCLSRRRSSGSSGDLTHVLHSSLLAVCFHPGSVGWGALLLSAACSEWRNEEAGRGEQNVAPCQPLPIFEPTRNKEYKDTQNSSGGRNLQIQLVGVFRMETEKSPCRGDFCPGLNRAACMLAIEGLSIARARDRRRKEKVFKQWCLWMQYGREGR